MTVGDEGTVILLVRGFRNTHGVLSGEEERQDKRDGAEAEYPPEGRVERGGSAAGTAGEEILEDDGHDGDSEWCAYTLNNRERSAAVRCLVVAEVSQSQRKNGEGCGGEA